jgi:tight adherence protein B
MDIGQFLCSFAMGAVVAVIAFTNQDNYLSMVDWVERDLVKRLRTLRMKLPRLRWFIHIWLGLVATVVAFLGIGLDSFPLAILCAVFACAGPWYLIRRAAIVRRQRIEDQLADAMVMFSSGVRAGMSLAQALELLSVDCPKPINQEFAQIVGEYKLGKPLERTLTEAKERLRSENFVLFAAALLASRESGGRLNETVERISKSVLEMQRLDRKVRSETAQAKKSAVYMAVVPPLILVVYAWLDPNNVGLLFFTLPGQLMLAVAVLLNVAAYLWARRILSPKL